MQRRTALLTAASVAGVVLLGATAVAANVAILDHADNSGIGDLSAAERLPVADITAENPQVSKVFSVEEAGTVEVIRTGGRLELGEVTTNPGFDWTSQQVGDTSLSVTFQSGNRTYEFGASLDEAGNISVAVEQPVATTDVSPTPTPSDDDHESDDHEDDDHGEHEGWDDDD